MRQTARLFLFTLGLAGLVFLQPASAPPATSALASDNAHVSDAYRKLPLSFEPNRGQADSAIKYLARGKGYQLSLTADGAALALHSGGAPVEQASGSVLEMQLVKANAAARIEPLDELPGKSNYLLGSNAQQWRTAVANYARVKYHAVYPNVDLLYYGQQGQLEYDFILQPGADPQQIRLAFAGAAAINLEANGDLTLSTGTGTVRQHKPVIYQEVDGVKQFVAGHYVQTGAREIGFEIGAYDPRQPLVIDPVLSYASYFGGSGFEHGNVMGVDAAGNLYLAGGTGSANLNTANPLQPNFGGNFDCFIAKFNPGGTALIYSTYLGGNGGDSCFGMAVEPNGNVFLTGVTGSSNFPTRNAFQTSYGGGTFDAFVAKLNADGTALAYASYLGGSGTEQGNGIAIDGSGAAYVIGPTSSTNFPVKNARQQSYGGGTADAFVVKVQSDGAAPVFATYLGGNGVEQGSGIAVDAAGNICVSGATTSTNFPTANALQPALAGTPASGSDVFVAKLMANGADFVYSTYLGGSSADTQVLPSNPLAVDAAGNVYLIGGTNSQDFPTVNPVQARFGGGTLDAFVTKLNANGSALVYSTYLGGSGNELATFDNNLACDIAVDVAGQAYVTGPTNSSNFPTAQAVQATAGGGYDAFITKFNASGSALVYSTYFGGSANDDALCIVVDALGNAYVSGRTASSNLPTATPLQPTFGGGPLDAILLKLGADAVTVSAASFSPTALAGKAIVAAFGPNLASATASAASVPLPTTLAGTTVRIRDSAGIERAAPLFFVSAQQVNYQIPDGAASGPAAVTITSSDRRVSSGVMRVLAAAPAIFTANASGTGAAIALDAITFAGPPFAATLPNGQPNILAVFGTGLGADATDVDGDVSANVQAMIAGQTAIVLYAGRVTGLVGLNQFNVQLPAGLAAGTHTLVVTRNGVASNAVTLAIR